MKKINLFCFPFAGGNKYSYRDYEKFIPSNIKLIPIESAGRGMRFSEKLPSSIEETVADYYDQIKDYLQEPYAIYGHSMGSLTGFLVAKKILEENLNPPLHLFFSGRAGPSAKDKDVKRHTLPKKEFIEELKTLDGIPEEVFNDEDLMELFEPILRADFKAIETYTYTSSEAINIPISVAIGKEEKVTLEEAETWQEESLHPVKIKQFPGKHFFIFQYPKHVMRWIALELLSIKTTVHN
ncbi:thioesterase II family protein [uncultured Kordia sp.]|uniref:thioesterase II family protein n=1 Tax=uncultured Kordia sp. TaxID=507699 RepID=UPI002636F0E3|nr:thioesterase domain-containing protein [uncultured Kordia sp.]